MQTSDCDCISAPGVGQLLDLHSTLEMAQRPDPPQVYSTLETRQADTSLFDTYKQSTTASPQPESFSASPETPYNLESEGDHHSSTHVGEIVPPRKWTLWILVALGIFIIIAAAAIGGGVGGTSHRSVSSAASSDHSPSSTTSIISPLSSSTSSSSSIVPGASTPTMSTAPSFPTPTAKLNTTLLNTTNLASLVWTLNGVTQYRVWYQTEDNMIREVGKNDTWNEWFVSGQSHGPAKSGSPIAASYTGPPDWLLVGALTHRPR